MDTMRFTDVRPSSWRLVFAKQLALSTRRRPGPELSELTFTVELCRADTSVLAKWKGKVDYPAPNGLPDQLDADPRLFHCNLWPPGCRPEELAHQQVELQVYLTWNARTLKIYDGDPFFLHEEVCELDCYDQPIKGLTSPIVPCVRPTLHGLVGGVRLGFEWQVVAPRNEQMLNFIWPMLNEEFEDYLDSLDWELADLK
jgi:hypothetical protein